MENIARFLIFSSSIFILFTIPTQSANSCKPDSCHSSHGPEIRFPFRLKDRQPARCGYPGFDLYCNTKNQTILHLPRSGEFVVDYIDYGASALLIDDPGSCLPARALNLSFSGSRFQASYLTDYVYFNCPGDWMDYGFSYDFVPLSCLSEGNSTVFAMNSWSAAPPTCRRIAEVSVPPLRRLPESNWGSMDFELVWSEPACGKCENRGGICGFKADSGLEIGCSKSPGIPRSAKYALILGVGIPGLLCIMGLACYACGMIKIVRHQGLPISELPTTTIFNQQPIIRGISGLNLPTIESYPKIVLGQSRRLPNPDDGTCSICLCEYQPKETIKSIPECNHYFHATCIDEWLKLNGTCPLCRNSPESSSMATSCSSTPLSSSSSATLDHH